MIKVKDSGNLFTYLMEHHKSLVDDIYLGYIYLNCTEDRFKQILKEKSYYEKRAW